MDHPTDLDLADQSGIFEFIKSQIILTLLNNDQKLIATTSFFKINKNNKIKITIDNIAKFDNDNLVCLFAYGPHLQKLLSVVELYKSKIISSKEFRQWNKLTSFDVQSEGRNELLEKKVKVPIMITFITTNPKLFQLPQFQNEEIGFTEQK